MKITQAILFGLLAADLSSGQKKPEKPKVHADFNFGSYPSSREASELLKDETARIVVVSYHVGWSPDKTAKELKIPLKDVLEASDKLEEAGLVRRDEYESRPAMLVLREVDYARIKDSIQRFTHEFTKVFEDNWKEIEGMVDSLEGSRSVQPERVLYETVVSGILLGGLVDAFWEDKTLMLNPPRRAKADRYYAWLVESNPAAAGLLKREIRESSGYRIITIGNTLSSERPSADDLRGKASVYEEADARRYRTFISVFSRDKLLPFFKQRRPEFIKLGGLIESGKYIAFAEFFSWCYWSIANGVVDNLVAAKRIASPETLYTYAIKAP